MPFWRKNVRKLIFYKKFILHIIFFKSKSYFYKNQTVKQSSKIHIFTELAGGFKFCFHTEKKTQG